MTIKQASFLLKISERTIINRAKRLGITNKNLSDADIELLKVQKKPEKIFFSADGRFIIVNSKINY